MKLLITSLKLKSIKALETQGENTMRKYFYMIPLASAALFFAGCSSDNAPRIGREHVQYGDPQAVETININFGSTDLQILAEKMVGSMLSSDVLSNKPTITVSTMRNKTSEYIDVNNIVNSIQTQLIKSGQVRFVRSTQEMQDSVDELSRQNESGYYNPDTTARIGKMIGAQYMLEGELTSINKYDKGKRRQPDITDVYYKFTLKLVNTEQGTIDWMDEQEIRKTSVK